MSPSDIAIFQKHFDYYLSLQTRRWQYFASLLIVDSLLLNSWEEINKPGNETFFALTCLGAISISIASLFLLSRSRVRIGTVGAQLNKMAGRKLLDTGKLGKLGFRGVTMWIYLSVLALCLPWFVALIQLNIWIAGIAGTMFIVSLFYVQWRIPLDSEIEAFGAVECADISRNTEQMGL